MSLILLSSGQQDVGATQNLQPGEIVSAESVGQPTVSNVDSATAIGRFVTVPNQVVDSTIKFKVAAFDKDGITKIRWNVDGGAWTDVTTATEDTDLSYSGITGLTLYQFTLTASDYSDGNRTVNVEIISNGTSITRSISSNFWANNGGTITPVTKYVDSASGSDTTGDGSNGNPYATTNKALNDFSLGDTGYIYLKDTGPHTFVGRSTLHTPDGTEKWVIVKRDPAQASTVVMHMNNAEAFIPYIGYHDVEIQVRSNTDLVKSRTSQSINALWLEDTTITTDGSHHYDDATDSVAHIITGNWLTNITTWHQLYAVRSHVEDMGCRPWLNWNLVYDCSAYKIYEDVLRDCDCVVGFNFQGLIHTITSSHADSIQQESTSHLDNVIYYGTRFKDAPAQQLGLFGNVGATMQDLAIVNMLGDYTGTGLKSQIGHPSLPSFDHILLYHVSLPNQSFVSNSGTQTNIVVRNCFFDQIEQATWPSGWTVSNCFANTITTATPPGMTLISTLDLADEASDQYFPLATSDLADAGATTGMPDYVAAEVGGNASTPYVGAYATVAGNTVTITQSAEIASAEDVGQPTISVGTQTITQSTAIDSAEDVGAPTLSVGTVTITQGELASEEDIPAPTITTSAVTISQDQLTSTEEVGDPIVSVGLVTVSPDAVSSLESVGDPTLTTTVNVDISGTDSSEDVPNPTLSTGPVTVSQGTISSEESVGQPSLVISGLIFPGTISSEEDMGSHTIIIDQTVSPGTVSSGESVGDPDLNPGTITITVGTITSEELFGTATITAGAVGLDPTTIASAESIPSPTLTNYREIAPGEISSAENFGSATLTVSAISAIMGTITSDEDVGSPRVFDPNDYVIPRIHSNRMYKWRRADIISSKRKPKRVKKISPFRMS